MRYHVLQRIALFIVTTSIGTTSQAETLLDIYELALKNDPTLQAAEATFKADSLIKAKAISALLPTIEGSYTYTETDTESKTATVFGTTPIPPSDTESDIENKTYQLSLTQNIFNLSAFFGYKQSKSLSEQAKLQLSVEQQSLLVRVAEAYFNVLRGKDNLTSSLAEEKAIAQQLEQTQQRYEVGLIAITDVHEAQAAYDLAIANRLSEEVNLGIFREALAAITGQLHANLFNLSEAFPILKPQPESADTWVKFAEQNNLSIKLSEQLLEAANQNARVKTSNMLPTIVAVARYTDSDEDSSNFDNMMNTDAPDGFSDRESTALELRLNVPIYSGGFKNAERKEAGYQRVASQANLVAAKRKALQDTRSSYLTTVTDTARVTARKRAITSAQSALDATRAGYDAGTRNIVDLLNAQRDLYRAQRDYANTRYDYVINSLRLKQAAGIISPKDIQDINKWLEPPSAILKSES